jgi:predicted RNA polymerase sigma factor
MTALPEKVDLELARREAVAILRRMADLIEQGQENAGLVSLVEVQRLRRRAAQLHAELRKGRNGASWT